MQIDDNTLKKLSAMDDSTLEHFISSVAHESGLSLPSISRSDLAKIRSLLGDIRNGDPKVTEAINQATFNLKKGSPLNGGKG